MNFQYIGKRIPRADGAEKASGKAIYINDLKRPSMLYGSILYSKYPHARIKNIDTSLAKKLPGIRAVITAQDIPEIHIGFLKDNRPLKKDKVRSIRDEIAAVAGTNPDIVKEALSLIKVEYEPLTGIFSPKKALEQNAPLIHESNFKGKKLSSNKIKLPWLLICGDPEKGEKLSKYIVEDTFSTNFVSHCCLGTSGVIAEFDLNKNLTMFSITQIPYLAQVDYLKALKSMGLKNKKVRVICQTIGGGFGSKLDTHCYEFIAILLSYKTNKPVKILFSREEEFKAQPTRQPTTTYIKQGCDKKGNLTFRKIKMILDNGAYTSWGATTPSVMMIPASSLYKIPNIYYEAEVIYTNNIYSQAFRGYGNPQATFAIESSIDQLAKKANIDPMDFRLMNSNQPGETTPQRFKITSCALTECINKVCSGLKWKQNKIKKNNIIKPRGIGIASLIHVGGGARVYRSDGHGIIMKLDDFANLNVFTGAVEIGQGSESTLRQVVAEEIGLPINNVKIISHDTDICPWDVGTHASRQTFVSCNAAIKCAKKIKKKLLAEIGKIINIKDSELKLKKGKIYSKKIEGKGLQLQTLLEKLHFTTQGKMIIAEAFYDPPNEMLDKNMKGNLSSSWAFGCHGVEVEVDVQTGQVKILNYQAAHDVGKALNPLFIEGQIYGGAIMGAGMALNEELKLKNGYILNGDFTDYKLLTAKDIIPVTPIIVESKDPIGPYGAKGIGEAGCIPSSAAISNAIYDAIGIRLKKLPMSPERILKAIKKKQL